MPVSCVRSTVKGWFCQLRAGFFRGYRRPPLRQAGSVFINSTLIICSAQVKEVHCTLRHGLTPSRDPWLVWLEYRSNYGAGGSLTCLKSWPHHGTWGLPTSLCDPNLNFCCFIQLVRGCHGQTFDSIDVRDGMVVVSHSQRGGMEGRFSGSQSLPVTVRCHRWQ